MKVLKYLIIALFIILPFGELLRFQIGDNIYIKALDVVSGCLAISILGWLIGAKKLRIVLKQLIAFLLFPIVCLCSLLINIPNLSSNELFASALYLIRWLAYLGVLFTVLQMDNAFKSKLVWMLFFSGLVILIAGYLQYFFYSDIRSLVSLGWDDHMYRLFATFYDPNFAGAFFVLYALFIGGLLVLLKQKKEKQKVMILSGVLVLTILAILLTFSRGAILMLLGGSFTLLVLLQKKRIMFGLLAIIAVFVLIASPFFRIENTNLFRKASSEARFETYANALTIFKDNPILGVGFNAYRYTQQDYGFRKVQTKYPSNADAGVDNSFLFVLATTGVVGFVAFLYFWWSLLKNALHHARKEKNILAMTFISSSVGLFINAVFINSLFFPMLIVWMWLLFGAIHADKKLFSADS